MKLARIPNLDNAYQLLANIKRRLASGDLSPSELFRIDLPRIEYSIMRKGGNGVGVVASKLGKKKPQKDYLVGLHPANSFDRPLALLGPLLGTNELRFERKSKRILIIGPRNESELLLYSAYGFEPSNIFSVDLLSYSEWVKPGDMHALPYDDNSFDVVIAGWVIAYSTNHPQAFSEMIRVSKNEA